jgi:predicted Co/Zn/Cd cation transporter (cation efflux family)
VARVKWLRLQVAYPFMLFSAMFLFPAAMSAVIRWSESSLLNHVFTVLSVLMFALSLLFSIFAGIGPRDAKIAWGRLGMVVITLLVGIGAVALRDSLDCTSFGSSLCQTTGSGKVSVSRVVIR